ncbi:MAG: alpha-glucan family phosphorylase [Mailhella sp.]|nr:alpha-glucan family phosphorylase [Mailhella sp.]
MDKPTRPHLFEVSWEVCNKVGGIYEVVASKAQHAVKAYDDEYFLIGPDTRSNTGFIETNEPLWDALRVVLGDKNLRCRFGRWDIPGRPRVILVDFRGRHEPNQILTQLWERFGVDSLSGGWDYIEPVLFSSTCGEVIAEIHQVLAARDHGHGVAQFHEWMCGAGILALKQLAPSMGTVFTTHATVLGRSMAGSGVDIYTRMSEIFPSQEADRFGVTAKCSMETVSAREADIFTTVSGITAMEARYFLGRTPDFVTTNGLDLTAIHDFSADRATAKANRKKLLAPVSKLLRREVPAKTRIIVCSGRYEFHNKGADLFLDALAAARDRLAAAGTPVLALMLMMGGHTGVNPAAAGGDPSAAADPARPGAGFITGHNVYDAPNDPILTRCRTLGIENRADDPVDVVFVPAMLDGNDGFFDMPYFDILSGCDLGIFPSWYEPWGYTPHESAAYGVPTVTTDLSGFGLWIRDLEAKVGPQRGIEVIARDKTAYDQVVKALADVIVDYASCTDKELDKRRRTVRAASAHADWSEFFGLYRQAYAEADRSAHHRRHATNDHNLNPLSKTLAPRHSSIPFMRTINAVSELPSELSRLRDIASNLGGCWQPDAMDMFAGMDASLWESCGHNPLYMVENTSPERLRELAGDPAFTARLSSLTERFDAYMAQPLLSDTLEDGTTTVSADRPIAYFSTEYGMHESLQLYSGGLGVLSGDHLKSSSDERLPLIGVGLFYLNGYFQQTVDKSGHQNPVYPENHPANLPLEPILDADGSRLLISLPLGNRTLYARVWRLQVGLVPLYLLDTNVPENSDDDRRITARLYEADRDVRLRQEILLGMGGVKMLAALGIAPSVWHMNEGHSAFLIIERLRQHMRADELTLEEAMTLVRSSCVFTTHTPVPAGNERFGVDLMARYFQPYASMLGMSWSDFLRLGVQDGGDPHNFDMTVLALRMSSQANGVSAMHGMVSRRMWRNIWKGFDEAELPISHVTNGVHTASYAGPAFRPMLDRYVGPNWLDLRPGDPAWEKVKTIPDVEFWNARRSQKQTLIDALRERLPLCSAYSDISGEQRQKWLSSLTQDTLIIGFARRFAPYKRATMLFADPDRLARLLNDPNRPVVLVMAGKAHPADGKGIELVEDVVRWSRDPRFFGKIFFVENYNLEVSRLLSRGCDVWLNTPRRPHEASGTSGEKVPVNGGINLSISDGWWVEGDNGENGWTIGPKATYATLSAEQNDYADAESLYLTLEDKVVPLFFQRSGDSLPHGWITVAKNSLMSLTAMYGCRRMVCDYMEKIYVPAARRGSAMDAGRQAKARTLTEWYRTIPGRFNTAAIEAIEISGLEGDTVYCGKPFTVNMTVRLGDMKAEEILAQLVIGVSDGMNFTESPDIVDLALVEEKDGVCRYTASCTAKANGLHAYGLRIVPMADPLDQVVRSGLVTWA